MNEITNKIDAHKSGASVNTSSAAPPLIRLNGGPRFFNFNALAVLSIISPGASSTDWPIKRKSSIPLTKQMIE
ncbi:hypothetical protein DERF_013792 [Dermatophagoides farinae]|uniref:Uncharacterized protein n=1 Tax=Dermatophagoides farinae TaxID=6954 RepID=A0A922L0X4_DERFA|nr:hypothetical protein DERF_013792 [Dermatophagoides farinae]